MRKVLKYNQSEFDTLHEEIASHFENEEDSFGSQLYGILQVLDEMKQMHETEIEITIGGKYGGRFTVPINNHQLRGIMRALEKEEAEGNISSDEFDEIKYCFQTYIDLEVIKCYDFKLSLEFARN